MYNQTSWLAISEYLSLRDVVWHLEFCCKRVQQFLRRDEVWKRRVLTECPLYAHLQTCVTDLRTELRLCYLESKRSVDYIGGQLALYSLDFLQSKTIVHYSGLPFIDLHSVCVLANGDIFGKTTNFAIFDIRSARLRNIAQPLIPRYWMRNEKGFTVATHTHVIYVSVTTQRIYQYDLAKDRWRIKGRRLLFTPLGAFRKNGLLLIVHEEGISEFDLHTWFYTERFYPDGLSVGPGSYLCSFLANESPVRLDTDKLIVGRDQQEPIGSYLTSVIPKESRAVAEDDGFVYFGRGSNLFKYGKKRKRVERFYCGGGGVDRFFEKKPRLY